MKKATHPRKLPNWPIHKLFSRSALKKLGLILTAISGALLGSTLTLPPLLLLLLTVAGIAGSILTILAQPSGTENDTARTHQQA